jgi:tRNA threonylcarbamoyladenosine biosynthesis protein TsaE
MTQEKFKVYFDMKKIISNNVDETINIGAMLAKHLKPSDVLALFGDLGSGKTALVRGIAKELGSNDAVSSPTFALVHEYHGIMPIYHFDMYRVSSWDDLYSTGFFDYLENGGICVVEWSENIENALPESAIKVSFEKGEQENERIISIEGCIEFENTIG